MQSKREVVTAISTKHSVPQDIDSFARGLVDSYIPENYGLYNTYRAYMHDILCHALINAGLFESMELSLEKLGIFTPDHSLMSQRPDLYTISGNSLSVCEVTLSYNAEFDSQKKQTKYDDFFKLIQSEIKLDISYSVICVDLADSEWSDKLPPLEDIFMELLIQFVDNLRLIHSSNEFKAYRSAPPGTTLKKDIPFDLDTDHIMSIYNNITGDSNTFEEFEAKFQEPKDGLTDDQYLDTICYSILDNERKRRPEPCPEAVSAKEFDTQWKDYKSQAANTSKIPRVLQLGCPTKLIEEEYNYTGFIDWLRGTTHFGGYLDHIKHFLTSNPGVPEEGMIKLPLTQEQLDHEQSQGPGRKSFLKRKGIKLEREAPTHIGIDESHVVRVENLTSKIDSIDEFELHQPDYPPLQATGPAMMDQFDKVLRLMNSSPMTAINKFYQRIAQEITLNSMKRRKSRQYVLGTSGFEGVFFLVAPGPQLRTESNTEFIKIISVVQPLVDILSAPWHPSGDHWESDWISVDTDRLKHWMRAHDRLIMCQLACSERLVQPKTTMTSALRTELKCGNYHFLSMCYLENKRNTSTTNQTIRYLWIKALGDKQMDGIYNKFPNRVNSVLQSTMLQRSYASTRVLLTSDIRTFIKVGSTQKDEETGIYDESTTGVVGTLPRMITVGERVPISYNLNEIYWCMLYNKDRQNQTQDSMGILNKILKEEAKFDEELSNRANGSKLDYVLGCTTVTEDTRHIHSKRPESHYFSNRAVRIGVELQDRHKDNVAPNSAWLSTTKLDGILNKKLSEFATFKASVRSICEKVDQNDLSEIRKLGSRTKAIELVYELVEKEELMTSLDVVMSVSGDKNSSFEVLIQIFKKNQIGGTREIIILFIKARIIFNVLEEVARLLSKSDRREILTKGKDKRLMMRGDYDEVMSQFKKGSPVQMIKNSYDMTTWAQHFIPTIFMCIHNYHFSKHPGMKALSTFLFTKHTDKKMEYPRKLVEQWAIHRELEHKEEWLKKKKQDFLQNGTTFFKNRSNMCQGIPHYNSTVLALSCQSLRDELFKRCLGILGQTQQIHWQTRVGSDDKGDIIGVDMSSKVGYAQYLLFEQCALAAERLHSMELSVKSASGNLIYELNSAFMVNLETLSPTIKFASASTDMIGTTSCSSFVNESYTRIRQLRENGSSSLICLFAHVLNREHFYQMFRVGEGMVNDPAEILDIPSEIVPFDLGHYPIYDCDLQEIIGAEFHNYLCMTDPRQKREVKQLLFTPLSSLDSSEDLLPSEDQVSLLKKDHFGVRQGMVRQLSNMRSRLNLTGEKVEAFLRKNPLMVIKGPQTLEEVKYTIASKLYTKGASESLRRTSPAIYFGRLTAFESAKAWTMQCETGNLIVDIETGQINSQTEDINLTYHEFLTMGIAKSKETDLPVEEMMDIIYPQRKSFDVIKQFIGNFGLKRTNSKYFSQAVRSWVVNNFNYNFTSSLRDIIETSFGESQMASISDVQEFKNLLGIKMDSLEDVLNECARSGIRPLDLFFYMTKIFKNVQSSKVQAFASGPSSNSLQKTMINLKRYNHLPNVTIFGEMGISQESEEESQTLDKTIDLMKLVCNLIMMEDQGFISSREGAIHGITMSDGRPFIDVVKKGLRSIKGILGFDLTTQKILIFVASSLLPPKEVKEMLIQWKTLNYSYIKRQRKIISDGQVKWEGDLELLVNSSTDVFTLNCVNGYYFLETKRIEDSTSLLRNLKTLCRMLDFDISNFFSVVSGEPLDLVLTSDNKSLTVLREHSNNVRKLNLKINTRFKYSRMIDYDEFNVKKVLNDKDLSIAIHLQERNKRSATICHMTGSSYPVEVPKNLVISEDIWCRGVRLRALLLNRDWFFNGRLPPLDDRDSVAFLRNDVNMDVVLMNVEEGKSRILDYVQVHHEVNEEAFGIMVNPEGFGQPSYKIDKEDFKTGRIMELFQAETDKLAGEEYLMGTFEGIEDWAEEVEAEHDVSKMTAALGAEEDGLRVVRSLGTYVPKKRRNHLIMSTLQQGAMLKRRILDMFFSLSSIMSEDRQSLPYYCLWLMDYSEPDNMLLIENLLDHIKGQIMAYTGSNKSSIDMILAGSNRFLKRPIPRLSAYLYSRDISAEASLYDMMNQQMLETQMNYEESISSSNTDS